MPVVEPQPPRHTADYTGNVLRIVVPSRKRWYEIAWYGFCLLLSAYMGAGLLTVTVVVIALGFGQASLIYGRSDIGEYDPWLFRIAGLILAIFLTALLAMCLSVLRNLLWLIVGKEIIEVNATTLMVVEKAFQWRRSQEYQLGHLSDLRIYHSSHFTAWPLEFWKEIFRPLGRIGMIAFDYGAKTYRFGLDLEQAEAKQIIRAIQDFLARPSQ